MSPKRSREIKERKYFMSRTSILNVMNVVRLIICG